MVKLFNKYYIVNVLNNQTYSAALTLYISQNNFTNKVDENARHLGCSNLLYNPKCCSYILPSDFQRLNMGQVKMVPR